VHAGLPAGNYHGINIPFTVLQNYQCGGFLEKGWLRVGCDLVIVAVGATQITSGSEQHRGYAVGVIE